MRKLNRYVARSVAGAIAMVLIVLLSLDFVVSMIDQLGSLRDNYNVYEALIYVLYSTPGQVYEYMPYATLIGCLVGLGILAGSSELVVMRAAGVSTGRISWMVLKPVFIFIAAGLLLGEYVTPYTDQVAESRRAIALERQTIQHQQGIWSREGDDFLHVNAILPNGVLYGVTRYRFNEDRELEQASYSRQATYMGGHWQEESVATTYFDGDRTRTGETLLRRWDTSLTPNLFNIMALPPKGLSISNLFYYTNFLREQNLDASDYSLAFWEKALQPLATASLVLIAISFVFGPLRSVTMGQRIFTGVVFGIVFRLSQALLGPSSLVFGFPPILAVLAPIVFCFGLGLYLLKRAG
ncbi:LPS export ABC transporter permease LptG [Marinimicrobium alkaliphilum]|uniref:LPS export ABC transporter permease LptG n=1 Tax=Marinimicrobium alkaliphilum TaxID=2202654 RepID=UPI000DBA69FE|nr:LPS export ABC transporter permease LptG [Marinimicrobium alkaliphilum]